MNAAFYFWRSARLGTHRRALVVALVCGLLGTVALGALAGARRTDSAYARYLASIDSSDVFVNVPGPILASVRQIEHLPVVLSYGAWLGLSAYPVVHGRVDESFTDDALAGSLDGEYFRQDRVTVVAGRLPRLDSTNEIALTPGLARLFGVGVGGRVTYQFTRLNLKTGRYAVAGYSTFKVTAIGDPPLVLVDQFDITNSGLLPPGATARFLDGEYGFGWVGVRLRGGPSGIPALQRELAGPEDAMDRAVGAPAGTFVFNIRRLDIIHHEVQQAIEPQAVALAIFGAVAVLALLVLVGQGLAQILNATSAAVPPMRAAGATRAQIALAVGLDGVAAVVGGVLLAAAGAAAVSPLAPVGPVRTFDPATDPALDDHRLGGALAVVPLALSLALLAEAAAALVGDLPVIGALPDAIRSARRRTG